MSRSDSIASAVRKQALMKEIKAWSHLKIFKLMLDIIKHLMYYIKAVAEKQQRGRPARRASERPSQSNTWQLNRNATLNIFQKRSPDKSSKKGSYRIIQNEPNQANYGADLDVNVWTVTVLNLNRRFPWDGSLRINNMRVWSWLRMNAGGVPNTCKSNGVKRNFRMDLNLVADGWVTRG